MIKKLLSWTIRSTLRPTLSVNMPVTLQRLGADVASIIVRSPKGFTTKREIISAVPTIHIYPTSAKAGRSLIYLHGGGYVVGSAQSHTKLAAHIGQAAQAQVCLVEYRLAPRHRCPDAINDVLGVYEALLTAGQDPAQLVIAGDSAGGGLTLATAIAIRDAGLRLPAALVLLSPWVDLSLSGETITTCAARDAMLNPEWIRWCAQKYCGDKPLTDPTCSPLYADLSGLPPVLIHVGTEEILLSDSTRIATQAQLAGVHTELKVFADVGHVFQFHAGLLKESDESIQDVGKFINNHLK